MTRLLRPMLLAATVLALVILASSATLRLAANGIGCSPWPGCYGLAETASAAQGTSLVKILRLTHRLTASVFAVIALAIILVGWRSWTAPSRWAALAMLTLTGLLAWVGLHTPSPLPAVTVVNVLGGLGLVGLSAGLLVCCKPAERVAGQEGGPSVRRALWALLALFALQAAVGAMISARLSGQACAGGCQQLEWSADAAALFNPMLVGRVESISAQPTAGQTLHGLHRILGTVLLVAGVATVHMLGAARAPALTWLAWVLAAAFSLGIASAVWDGHLPATVTHALLAGGVAASLGVALIGGLRPRRSHRK